MPNIVFHSVWNLSPTLSVGNNLLYESSFVEHIGSGRGHGEDQYLDVIDAIKGLKQQHLTDVNQQINEEISKDYILNYEIPKVSIGYTNSICVNEAYYDWSQIRNNKLKQ